MEALLHVRGTVIQCRDRAVLLQPGMGADLKGNIHLKHDEFKNSMEGLLRGLRGVHQGCGRFMYSRNVE